MKALNSLKLALCQIKVGTDKAKNIAQAAEFIDLASKSAAQMVVLPEVWNSPYSNASFPVYAEKIPSIGESPCSVDSPSTFALCEKAKQHSLWLVGGSIPERDFEENKTERLYNTCVVINPLGSIVAKHRKVHLFDIDIPGKITFRESDSLTPGNNVTVFDTPWGNIGIGICYDIRFPEYAAVLRQRGCRMLVYPGAFNMTTGPAHWELLQRGRAVDNQCFVATCSPARDEDPNAKGYIPWGHSTVVAPWGDIVAKAGAYQELVVTDVDFQLAEDMRQSIPCWVQKRSDLYEIIDKSKHDT